MSILITLGTAVLDKVSVQVDANSRVHLGLISMHADGPRKHGGIGFAIKGPTLTVEVSRASELGVRDERTSKLTPDESRQVCLTVSKFCTANGVSNAIHLTISGEMPTHSGLGSGTAIRLAALEGISLLFDLAATAEQLVLHSGRGGTSGIGVTTYFSGGMILDLGHSNDYKPLLPSSKSLNSTQPVTLPKLNMWEWPLCVCLPIDVPRKTQAAEVEFFSRATPLAPSDSFYASYEALFGVYASVLTGDYAQFCRSVDRMQNTVWKSLEWNEYGAPLRRLKSVLENRGVDCVCMSSLGPALVCFASEKVIDGLLQEQKSLGCEIFATRPSNVGRTVIWALT